MNDDQLAAQIRHAIGGDVAAAERVVASADSTDDAMAITMAALIERLPDRLARADALAATSRDRQVVAIARAHIANDHDLVSALARDHLVDFPDSLIVSWIAADAVVRSRQGDPDD